MEEMTKVVLEAEDEGAAERTVAAVPSPALAVPASLHASLMARLDRLGSAKGVAQIGATIGREFPHAGACGAPTRLGVRRGYSWFTEGFDTLDLREAKALLDNLA